MLQFSTISMFVVSLLSLQFTLILTFEHRCSLRFLFSVSQLSIGLTLLSIKKETLNEIDYNNLINNFASQKA